MQVSRIALITLITLLFGGNAYAHHGSGPVYDSKKNIKLTGVVVKYDLRSPHTIITMDVKNAAGAVERWEVESHAVGTLKRMGLDKDKLKPGDVITVEVWPNRKPERRLVWLNQVTTADGKVVGINFAQLIKARSASTAKITAKPGAVGIEKLAGIWEMSNFDIKMGEMFKNPLALTPAGQEAAKKFDPLRSPNLDCTPASSPWIFLLPYLHEFKVSGQEVILHHEAYDVVRTVSLNAKPKKADKAGVFGLLSGRVEGDDLVVNSSGYPPNRWGLTGAGIPIGGFKDIPSSAQKKVTERYSVSADGNTLTVAYTVEDPVYLTKPYADTVTFSRLSDDTPMDFKCDVDSSNRFLK